MRKFPHSIFYFLIGPILSGVLLLIWKLHHPTTQKRFWANLVHSKVLKSIFYCFLFFWWAVWYSVSIFTLVVVLPFLKTVFLFHLCDVERGNIQTVFIFDVGFYLWIGCGGSGGFG